MLSSRSVQHSTDYEKLVRKQLSSSALSDFYMNDKTNIRNGDDYSSWQRRSFTGSSCDLTQEEDFQPLPRHRTRSYDGQKSSFLDNSNKTTKRVTYEDEQFLIDAADDSYNKRPKAVNHTMSVDLERYNTDGKLNHSFSRRPTYEDTTEPFTGESVDSYRTTKITRNHTMPVDIERSNGEEKMNGSFSKSSFYTSDDDKFLSNLESANDLYRKSLPRSLPSDLERCNADDRRNGDDRHSRPSSRHSNYDERIHSKSTSPFEQDKVISQVCTKKPPPMYHTSNRKTVVQAKEVSRS